MKKFLFLIICVLPVGVFGDETVVNGGFNSGMTGWTCNANNLASIKQCDTTYCSAPRSCQINARGDITSGCYYGIGTVSQSINPAVSCTCKVTLKYREIIEYSMQRYISITLTKNGKDATMWKIPQSPGGAIGENMVWTQHQEVYTDKDTISGIQISVCVESPASSSYINRVLLWVDDVSITGTLVPAVEESKLVETYKFSASPNPFTTTAILRLQDSQVADLKIQIYDVSGKLVETTDKTIIGKNLKAGIYFIKVNECKSLKITKIK